MKKPKLLLAQGSGGVGDYFSLLNFTPFIKQNGKWFTVEFYIRRLKDGAFHVDELRVSNIRRRRKKNRVK